MYEKTNSLHLSVFPAIQTGTAKNRPSVDPFSEPPRKPDWLVLLMSALFLLTLLIVWFVS